MVTVANHRLITVIRFVAKSYTHPLKCFANRLYLVLHACEILFPGNVRARFVTEPNKGQVHSFTRPRWSRKSTATGEPACRAMEACPAHPGRTTPRLGFPWPNTAPRAHPCAPLPRGPCLTSPALYKPVHRSSKPRSKLQTRAHHHHY